MDSVMKQEKYWDIGICWAVRILASLLVALVLVIFIGESFFYPGEGPPNPFKQPLPVQIEFAGMFAILIGMIVGWRWEGIAAALVLSGVIVFHIIQGKLWLNWVFGLFDLVGLLFLLCWWLKTPRRMRE